MKFPEQHRVPRWKSLFINALDTVSGIVVASQVYQKPLPELAEFYIKGCLKLNLNWSTHVIPLLDIAVRKSSRKNHKEQIVELLVGNVPDHMVNKITALFDECLLNDTQELARINYTSYTLQEQHLQARIEEVRAIQEKSLEINDIFESAELSMEVTDEERLPKKQKIIRGEGNTLVIPQRIELVSAKTFEFYKKITLVAETFTEFNHQQGLLVETYRQWYVKNIPKVANCLNFCCNGNIDLFISKNKINAQSKFKQYTYKCDSNVCTDTKNTMT